MPHQPEDEEELPEVQVRAVPRRRDEAGVGAHRGGEGEEVQVRTVDVPNQGFFTIKVAKVYPQKQNFVSEKMGKGGLNVFYKAFSGLHKKSLFFFLKKCFW